MAGDGAALVLPDPGSDTATLRAFVAVARLGTVGRAAEALGRTQPSISARLASLEEAWGTRLFRREARGMALTPEGARLLPGAEAALRALEELDRVAGLPVSGAGHVRLGAGDALGRELLPKALGQLTQEQPGLQVRLLEGPGTKLLEALQAGRIDLALVLLPRGSPALEGLDLAPLLKSPVDLLLPPGRRLRGVRSAPLKILQEEPLVALQPDSSFRRHVEAALAAHGMHFRPAVEVGNLSLVRRFVSAGLGVAPVPALAFSPDAPGPPTVRGRLRGVGAVRYQRAVRSDVPLPGPTRRLLEILHELKDSEAFE